MAKKKTDYSKWHSFYENGQKYLQCWSCLKHFPVDDNCGKLTCSRCGVIRSVAMFPETLPKSYKKKTTGQWRRSGGRVALPDDIEPVAHIQYRQNTMVGFLNTVNSLHGVTPRENPTNIRRYVNIDCHVQEKLFKFQD